MDLVQLKRFLVSAELGSFGKAARQLNITQPALTQSIKSLEALLGENVFVRGARGVKLTAFGTMLVPRAQLIVNETNRIRDDIGSLKSAKNTKLEIGVAPYLINHIFPKALDGFMDKMPEVSVKITVEESSDLARLLVINEIDLAFCGYNEVFAHDQALKFEGVLKQKYRLTVRGAHPALRQRAPTTLDLAAYRWAIYNNAVVEQRVTHILQAQGVNPLPEFIRTNSLPMMKSLALQTDSVSLLPVDYIAPELRRGELVVVESAKFEVMAESGILSRRDVAKSSAVRQLISFIQKNAEPYSR